MLPEMKASRGQQRQRMAAAAFSTSFVTAPMAGIDGSVQATSKCLNEGRQLAIAGIDWSQ
jgi:hypothetical protein